MVIGHARPGNGLASIPLVVDSGIARLNVRRGLGATDQVRIKTWGGWTLGLSILQQARCEAAAVRTAQGAPGIVQPDAWVFLPQETNVVPVDLIQRDIQLLGDMTRGTLPPTIIAAPTPIDMSFMLAQPRLVPLPDHEIKSLLLSGELQIDPISAEAALQPCSVDVRLGRELVVISSGRQRLVRAEPGDLIEIRPGDLVLAPTLERLRVPRDMVGILQGASSLARKGIAIHRSANIIHPGADPDWVALELTTTGQPNVLVVGGHIGTIVFSRLSSPCERHYDGRYHQGEVPQDLLLHAKGITNGNG